jgi:hypothetical protein
MAAAPERRALYRNGVLILFVSALLGLVAGSPVPHPQKWMALHVSGLLAGVLVIAIGGLWPAVRLPEARRRLAWRLLLGAAWMSLTLNLFVALVNAPGPATEPGRPFGAPWQQAVYLSLVLVVVVATLTSLFLIWRGLRGAPDPAA